MSDNACCVYDFTSYCCDEIDSEGVIKILKESCKKYCFQLESCPTTQRLHYQGRISLKVKKRSSGVASVVGLPKTHFSVTSTANRDNDFYVCKEERVDGPWRDTDVVVYRPRDVRETTTLYPWQAFFTERIKYYDERVIDIIYDPVGCKGKSRWTRWCRCEGLGRMIPYCNDYKDILRMVMCMPKSLCYFIDMPRGIGKERLFQLYAAIETVKGGYAYDDRYKFRDELFDPPRIVVFTNKMPDLELLSLDRWKIWGIREDLTPYEIPISTLLSQ